MTLSGLRRTLAKEEEHSLWSPLKHARKKIDLRLTPTAKRTLQIAASAAHRSVSEFVLESTLARAEETLPDRQRFGLDAKLWEAFQAALDAPPRIAPRLKKLLQESSVFERASE